MRSSTRLWHSSLRAHWRILPVRSWRRQLSVSAAELRFGQPLHETHPHLLRPGEVTPGISAQEYYTRRAKLAKALPPNSIAILAASDLKYRSGAVFYRFHQDPDFLYLTGFNEPDALAIIEKLEDDEHSFHLYVRPKDPKAELWEGSRSGIQAAEDVFNADTTGDINNLPKLLPEIIKGKKEVYTDLPNNMITRNMLTRYLSGMEPARLGGISSVFRDATGVSVNSLRPFLNELRVIKSEAEIRNMRKVGQHSGRAITDAMRQSFTNEKDLESFLDYWFKQDGCDGPAYVPVVAGGINANTIHYVSNDKLFKPNDLVLVDAGAEYGGYITDISRTWPVNGKFTQAQNDLYSALLKVQRSCVSLCYTASNLSLDRLHKIARSTLEDSLQQLGFDMSNDAIDILFPHHVGHYIGLDVHDSPGLPRNRSFEKGMCVTVEPGVYVPDDERWPKWARGMGMRIEDSVCVDEEQPYILTTEAVKEVVDIESLRD
ncbi:xaa-Pro aminopeptidase-like protein [Lojkania enalia]|uniref:Xaa-Pro aminopeptidase n=1 Tax=Lojkania enalia TaxID=147567 RepID=A0A9P4MY30_9PLEO|nr:xaa-Pro aminopeptidase-like protein [Didymosphaeria enalia]